MTHQDTCKTCRYWGDDQDVADRRECKRHAPIAHTLKNTPVWPSMYTNNWCGEHEPVKAERVAFTKADQIPPFPHNPDTISMQQLMTNRAAREAREYGQSLDEDTARNETPALTTDEAQQAHKPGTALYTHCPDCETPAACELGGACPVQT